MEGTFSPSKSRIGALLRFRPQCTIRKGIHCIRLPRTMPLISRRFHNPNYLKLSKKEFELRNADFSANKKGKSEYLKHQKNELFIRELNKHFTSYVNISPIKVGAKQEIETLISEEALLLAKYLRHERKEWIPRLANI